MELRFWLLISVAQLSFSMAQGNKYSVYSDTFELADQNEDEVIQISLDTISLTEGQGMRLNVFFTYDLVEEGSVIIARTFTNDPHFICKYPQEPLKKDTVYSMTVCFTGRLGILQKSMGFIVASPTGLRRVTFRFTGYFRKEDK